MIVSDVKRQAMPSPIAEGTVRIQTPQRILDIRKTLKIMGGTEMEEISAATSDDVAYIELSSRLQWHFWGKHRLGYMEEGTGYVFERTGWIWKRQLALSPTYAFACAGVTKEGRFAITFYRTEINEQAAYLSDPIDLIKFDLYYDGMARCFRTDLTVREGRKDRFQAIAFSDRRYMPQPFQIEKSENRTVALRLV
jgi:hypothetical protein